MPHHHLADSRHQQGQLNPQSCPEPTCWTNFAAKAAIFLPSVQPSQVASDHAIISKRLPTAPTTDPAKIYGRKSPSVVGNPSQSTPSEQGNRREPQFLELPTGQPVSTTATSSRPRASSNSGHNPTLIPATVGCHPCLKITEKWLARIVKNQKVATFRASIRSA